MLVLTPIHQANRDEEMTTTAILKYPTWLERSHVSSVGPFPFVSYNDRIEWHGQPHNEVQARLSDNGLGLIAERVMKP